LGQLAHHTFSSGSFTDLRVIEAVQCAGSVHTLRVQYPLATPNSQLGGSYLRALEWSAGPRLRFVFGLSDLNRARYAEAWLPCNLIFDQFAITLEVQIVNTLVAHSVITNGIATPLGANHWHIEFPARFTALSPLLEIRASDTLELQTDREKGDEGKRGRIYFQCHEHYCGFDYWPNMALAVGPLASLAAAEGRRYVSRIFLTRNH
jgi:hypothetical protein